VAVSPALKTDDKYAVAQLPLATNQSTTYTQTEVGTDNAKKVHTTGMTLDSGRKYSHM